MTDYDQVRIEEVEVDDVGKITVVRFCQSRISDSQEIEELGQDLYRLIEEQHRKRLLLDFADVEFFSSAAIGKLISLNGKLKARSGTMRLCNLRQEILTVFRVCRLDLVFAIRQDVADGLGSFGD